MADVMVDLIDAVTARAKDASAGVNARLASVNTAARKVARIYDSFDEVDRIVESPALFIQHIQATPEPSQFGHRDWTHRFAFLYKDDHPDQDKRRKNASWVVQALLLSLDPLGEDPHAVFAGANVYEILTLGTSTIFDRHEDHRDEALIAVMDIRNRETM